jgi:serine/threonine protein kinase
MTSMGRFEIVDRISEGGMGALYRARDLANRRMVALKTTRHGSRAETIGLRCEGAILQQLQHPGIVRILARGRHEGLPWIALELLKGRTLEDELEAIWAGTSLWSSGTRRFDDTPTASLHVASSGAFRSNPDTRPPAAAGRLAAVCTIVAELAEILAHVHGRGLVHRDVKPSNVFLRKTQGGGARVTLLDFGLACRAGRAPRDLCAGTMQYAAPEQILGDQVDARADIYALGCVLFRLVTGACAFEGRTSHELARAQLYQAPLAPSRLVSDLPSPIEELLMEMLAKDPGQRPVSAGAVADRLSRLSLPGAAIV